MDGRGLTVQTRTLQFPDYHVGMLVFIGQELMCRITGVRAVKKDLSVHVENGAWYGRYSEERNEMFVKQYATTYNIEGCVQVLHLSPEEAWDWYVGPRMYQEKIPPANYPEYKYTIMNLEFNFKIDVDSAL